jgi:hypothetical protein
VDRKREAQDDLRSTSDTIRAEATTVDELEAEKMALHPGDPKVTEISRKVVEITGHMQRATLVEQELTEEVRAASEEEHERGSDQRPN